MLQISDSRRRFVIPKEAGIGPNSPADVEILPDGRVMITPMTMIPVHEAWAVTPESRAQTVAAMADYRAGRIIGTQELDALIAIELKKRGGK